MVDKKKIARRHQAFEKTLETPIEVETKEAKETVHTHEEKSKVAEKKTQKTNWVPVIIAVVIIAVAAVILLNLSTLTGKGKLLEGVAALVNGEAITTAELDAQYNLIPEMYRSFVSKDDILDQMVSEKVLLLEAKNKGIVVTEKEALAAITEALGRSNLTMEDYTARLAEQGLTADYVKQYYVKQMTIQSLLNESIPQSIISDEEALTYYNENPDLFKVPEAVRASHILVNTSLEAKNIISMLEQGADFSTLASRYSLDNSKVRGGDLGFFERGSMVPEFEEAAFKLKVGEYTKVPVQSKFGYHIILVTNKTVEQMAPFESVSSLIKEQLALEAQQGDLKTYVEALRSKATIVKVNFSDIKVHPSDDKEVISPTTTNKASSQISAVKTAGPKSFNTTIGPVCTDNNGKPIVRMFGAKVCPHCQWISATYQEVVKKYVASGDIVAYEWEIDTGDDVLTSVVETSVPQSEMKIFRDYNPKGGVPTFVFGCKYVRIGTYYERENDLASEKADFEAAINALIG